MIHDYYHAIEEKLIPEPPAAYTIDLLAEGEELPPVEVIPEADPNNLEAFTYPRLDKFFEKALKAQVVPDVLALAASNAAAGKAAGKAPPKGKGAAVEEEKPTEDSIYVKEMKEAIKVEKSILRYRLTLIRNWCLSKLKEMRLKCNNIYQKLDDWILVAVKAENEAVDEMCGVIKTSIEEEKKI